MHEKQVFVMLTGRSYFFHPVIAVNMSESCNILSTTFQMKESKRRHDSNFCAHFLTIRKAIRAYFPLKPGQMWTQSGQSSSGQGWGRQHREVCFNMSTWKILKGNIMDSVADVSLCLHAWNWGWALWSKWKRTAEVCSMGESELCTESKSENRSHLRIFPGSPAESVPSVIRDMGIPWPVALIHLSLGTACNRLASPVETVWVGASGGRPPMPAYFLPQSSFLY